MSLGMSYDEYWNGDVWMIEAYREMDNLKRQRKSEEMWLQGLYIYNAVSVSINNALLKKGARPQKYMEEPIRVVPYSKEEKDAIAERERQKTIDYFNRLAEKWGNKEETP